MDDVKDKMKGFMKKVNNLTSSSSGKFKGPGRVLGSSSSSGPANQAPARSYRPSDSRPSQQTAAPANPKPAVEKPVESIQQKTNVSSSAPIRKPAAGFDPFDALVTSAKRSTNGYSLNVFECPVCGRAYGSEEEVSEHVESCLDTAEAKNVADDPESPKIGSSAEVRSEAEACFGAYLSGKPSDGSVEIVLKLLMNIVKEPENAKFRRIRMGNPKIREAISEVTGGVELLECVGFKLGEEDGEIWAVMDVPTEEQILTLKKAIPLLEPCKVEKVVSVAPLKIDEPVEPKKVDRQIRVFFSVPESVAAKIQLPDSFYNLTREEVKREADMRRQKLAESQLLIPRSYKEKQAKAARRKYKRAVIRVQFPDGVVLQSVFSPREPTSAIYELVSSALKEPSLEFQLLHPVAVKRRVIPAAGERAVTLEEEDLVPCALIKFRPIETDSVVFTGLCNELLEIIEPLDVESAVAPL